MNIDILEYKIRADIRSILFHLQEANCIIDNISYGVLYNNQIDQMLIEKLTTYIIENDNTDGIIFRWNDQDIIFDTVKLDEQKYLYKLYVDTDNFNHANDLNGIIVSHLDSVHYLKDFTEYYHLIRDENNTYVYIANNRSHNKILMCLPLLILNNNIGDYYSYMDINFRCLYERINETLSALINNTEYKIIKSSNNLIVSDYRYFIDLINTQINNQENLIELCKIYNISDSKYITLYFNNDINRFIGYYNQQLVIYNRVDLIATIENRYEVYQTHIEINDDNLTPL